ncbi:TNT domain-containing protein [Streptomyces sp. NPDC056796]|uniref:TNT domain-containing protein n=1 Tax=Streptomyces sp. NPDC056796 TaxID=3345947 RepID=UPI00367EA44D
MAALLETGPRRPVAQGLRKYPPHDGFAEADGGTGREPAELHTGQRLDRFGSEYGTYLAPAGDTCTERPLPPQSLNTADTEAPCDHRVYKVAKPFRVWQGSTAPWFGQAGGGRRIRLDPVFLDPGAGRRPDVSDRWTTPASLPVGVQHRPWTTGPRVPHPSTSRSRKGSEGVWEPRGRGFGRRVPAAPVRRARSRDLP